MQVALPNKAGWRLSWDVGHSESLPSMAPLIYNRYGGFRAATSCTTSHLQGGAPWKSTLELRHKGLLQRHDWTSYEELRPDSRTTKPVSSMPYSPIHYADDGTV